jgi:lipoyl(octanoyl) transferase
MTVCLRIIDDFSHSAAFNMAADLYCLDSCVGESVVYFRLYDWQPPCITIGYMQKAIEILDLERLKKDDIAWIRRPTGGRAVLHDRDITYSCIFPISLIAMGKNVMETYSIISQCLITGIALCGIKCDSHDSFDQFLETKREFKLPCFLAPNRKEIMAKGKKLVGSAQKRTTHAVLQHGSIPMTEAYRNLPDYLLLIDAQRSVQKELLGAKSVCLKDINPTLEASIVRHALIKGVVASLPFETIEKPWTKEEVEKIEVLAHSEEFRNHWMAA